MSRTFSAFVRGVPAPKGSKKAFNNRKTGRAIIVDDNPKGLRDWEKAVREVLQKSWEGPPMQGAIAVRLEFSVLKPPSVSKKRTHPEVKPDIDKLARAAIDPMSSIAFRDDAQVCDLRASKSYGDQAGVRIFIEEM